MTTFPIFSVLIIFGLLPSCHPEYTQHLTNFQSLNMVSNSSSEWLDNFVAPNPSPRKRTIPRESSTPDRIEERMQIDGHRTWGFVIYRTTYESDDEWSEFMRQLREFTEDGMEFYNGQDILDLMTWTVFDDRQQFDGLDAVAVRNHFRQWCDTAVQSEQQQPCGTSTVTDAAAVPIKTGQSPRYRYCVQVDAASLRSVVDTPTSTGRLDHPGWVKLIEKDWKPLAKQTHPGLVERAADPDSYTYEPVEGITEEDVGWVKVPFVDVMAQLYALLIDLNYYSLIWCRPPEMYE